MILSEILIERDSISVNLLRYFQTILACCQLLFYRNGLGQVTGLVYVAASHQSDMVGQQL